MRVLLSAYTHTSQIRFEINTQNSVCVCVLKVNNLVDHYNYCGTAKKLPCLIFLGSSDGLKCTVFIRICNPVHRVKNVSVPWYQLDNTVLRRRYQPVVTRCYHGCWQSLHGERLGEREWTRSISNPHEILNILIFRGDRGAAVWNGPRPLPPPSAGPNAGIITDDGTPYTANGGANANNTVNFNHHQPFHSPASFKWFILLVSALFTLVVGNNIQC